MKPHICGSACGMAFHDIVVNRVSNVVLARRCGCVLRSVFTNKSQGKYSSAVERPRQKPAPAAMANREVYFRLGQRPEVSWTMEYIARPLCTIAVWTRTSSAARMNSVAIVSASRRFADLFARQRSRANLNAATHAVEN